MFKQGIPKQVKIEDTAKEVGTTEEITTAGEGTTRVDTITGLQTGKTIMLCLK